MLVVTGTGTGSVRPSRPPLWRRRPARRVVDVAVCKPVQTGTAPSDGPGDDDLVEVHRLAGVTELSRGSLSRAAGARRRRCTGRPFVADGRRGGRVGAGRRPSGSADSGGGGRRTPGGTRHQKKAQIHQPGYALVGGLRRWSGWPQPKIGAFIATALASRGLVTAGLVIGSWPGSPGPAELTNREALAALAPLRAVLPAGAAALHPAQFTEMSSQAFDAGWVGGLRRGPFGGADLRHRRRRAIQRIWRSLAAAGLPSHAMESVIPITRHPQNAGILQRSTRHQARWPRRCRCRA